MEYNVSRDLKDYIAEKIDVDIDLVTKVYESFQKVKDHKKHGFEQQYLAHLIRTLESHLREKFENPLFNIILTKLPNDDPCLEVGTAQFIPKRHFTIFYHPDMDKKNLRVCLAHELGHLFCAALLSKEDIEEFNSEPVSTLFGIFKILDKNQFYTHAVRDLCHPSPKAIVDSFIQMNNRKNEIFHSS